MPGPATIPVWASLSPPRLEHHAGPLLGAMQLKWGTIYGHCPRLTDLIDKQINILTEFLKAPHTPADCGQAGG